jgi:hypothetical protein
MLSFWLETREEIYHRVTGDFEEKLMKSAWARHWPLVVAVAVLSVVAAIVFCLCLRADGGHFVYAIDDVYITMAIARNFGVHGVWGVTPYEFTSSTSTFLWLLLLALNYALGGTSELAPLILNVVVGGVTLFVVYVILRKMRLPQSYQAAALLAVLFLSPLPAMIFLGMEHTLQIGISIPFVYVAAHDLAGEKGARVGVSPGLWVLAVVLPLIRYEGLFLVFAVCLLLFVRKRWVGAFGLGVAAAAPLVIYGAISVRHGWYWLPNTVFMKANLPHTIANLGSLPLAHQWDGWVASADVWMTGLALLLLLALLVRQYGTVWRESIVMIVIVIMAAGLHMRFARFGWFFRYEAYLVALSLFVSAVGAFEYLSDRRGRASNRFETLVGGGWLAWSLFCLFVVLGLRGYNSLSHIPRASHNIYEQQYQMGLFLRQYYRGASIAANDIGAVCYLGEPHLEDLWGLGSLDVARQKLKGVLTTATIDQLTRSKATKIAILYAEMYSNGYLATGGLPAQWIEVGRWKSLDNYLCAGDTVSFYAVDRAEEKNLIAHLREFASRLPREVEQSGKYTQPN